MQNDAFDLWLKATKNMANPLQGLSKTMTDICQRTMQQQCEIMSESLSLASDHLKRVSQVKKPEELLSLQKEALTENLKITTKNVQKVLSSATTNLEELTKCCHKHQSHCTKAAKDTAK